MAQASSTQTQEQIKPTAWIKLSFIVGTVLLAGGLILLFATWQRIQTMNVAAGVIVALDEYRDQVNGLTYLPVVEFKTADAKTVRTKTSIRQKITILGIPWEVDSVMGSPEQYHVGDQMRVYYDPRNPELTHLDDGWQLWAVPFGVSGVGVLVVLMALVVSRMTK